MSSQKGQTILNDLTDARPLGLSPVCFRGCLLQEIYCHVNKISLQSCTKNANIPTTNFSLRYRGSGRAESSWAIIGLLLRECLLALLKFYEEYHFNSVLDLGTGTGILAIAAALLGADSVLAVDMNPLAVRTALQNIRWNGLEERV